MQTYIQNTSMMSPYEFPWMTSLFVIIIVLLVVSFLGKPGENIMTEGFKYNFKHTHPNMKNHPPDVNTHTHRPDSYDYNTIQHAKLNFMNGVDYVDRKPPSERGEHRCHTETCPSVFKDGIVCWKCDNRIVDHQFSYDF